MENTIRTCACLVILAGMIILPNRSRGQTVSAPPKSKLNQQTIYVVGAVVSPGVFQLGQDETITILKALNLAGGIQEWASLGQARIIRHTRDASKTEISIDVKQVLAGRARNIELKDGDIVFVLGIWARKPGRPPGPADSPLPGVPFHRSLNSTS